MRDFFYNFPRLPSGHLSLVFNPKTAPFVDLFWRPVEAAGSSVDVTAVSAAARDAA